MSRPDARLGFVVIGKNEGARLERCLRSLPAGARVVYVDSASTDDSLAIARRPGVEILALESDDLMTAARARNAGFERLRATAPGVAYVMFVDGDSALDPAFPEAAAAFLDTRPDAAVVCGVVRERDRDKNVFHRLCEIEWQAAAGEALFCGGIAMMRAEAFRDAGGFRTDLLGGEEPELCLRLRERGHKIWRIEAPMAVHDADIAGVGRWLSRMRRGGRAFAEIASLHRHSPTRIWRREAARAVFWAAIAPAALIGGLALHPWAFAALAAYPAQIIRMATLGRGRLPPAAQDFAWPYAFFMTLAKFPEALGVLDFILSSARRSRDDRRPPGAPESC